MSAGVLPNLQLTTSNFVSAVVSISIYNAKNKMDIFNKFILMTDPVIDDWIDKMN